MRSMLLIQFACTLAMTGLIWFVQIVHYPLFALIAPVSFAPYEAAHATRTGWVVGPLMLGELATGLLLLLPACRPVPISSRQAIAGAALLASIWLSTALLQVPLHNRLATGYDARAIATLIATNWIRTIAWTLRSALVLSWMARLLPR